MWKEGGDKRSRNKKADKTKVKELVDRGVGAPRSRPHGWKSWGGKAEVSRARGPGNLGKGNTPNGTHVNFHGQVKPGQVFQVGANNRPEGPRDRGATLPPRARFFPRGKDYCPGNVRGGKFLQLKERGTLTTLVEHSWRSFRRLKVQHPAWPREK